MFNNVTLLKDDHMNNLSYEWMIDWVQTGEEIYGWKIWIFSRRFCFCNLRTSSGTPLRAPLGVCSGTLRLDYCCFEDFPLEDPSASLAGLVEVRVHVCAV